MFGDATSAELDELDILQGLQTGEWLIFGQYRDKTLHDRWLVHKKETIDIQDIQAGEEIRIRSA